MINTVNSKMRVHYTNANNNCNKLNNNKDNYFEWINIKECGKLLFHIHQYYAVQQALKEKRY